MNRVKLLATRLLNTYLFRYKYFCPSHPVMNWRYNSGYCGSCGRKLVKTENRFNLCPHCGEPKLGGDFCKGCGHAFMRVDAMKEKVVSPAPEDWIRAEQEAQL